MVKKYKKLDSTLKDRAKYLAQYLGFEVTLPSDGRNINAILVNAGFEYIHIDYKKKQADTVGEELSWESNGNHDNDALHTKLILRHLSVITNEELLEVVKILKPDLEPEEYPSVIEHKDKLIKAFNDRSFKIADNDLHPLIYLQIYQYLQSQGYAIPFGKYSVEEMEELGWIILIK